jgi:hypothetical protein
MTAAMTAPIEDDNMRYLAVAMIASLTVLAACGSSNDVAMKDASAEDVAKAMAEAKPIKAGKWETVSEVVDFQLQGGDGKEDAAGKSVMAAIAKSMKGKKTTFSHCVTAEEAKKPGEEFFTGKGKAEGCKYDNFTMTDGKLDATMTCRDPKSPDKGSMTMTMAGQYADASYDLDVTMNAKSEGSGGNGGAMTIRAKNSAKWIGACES